MYCTSMYAVHKYQTSKAGVSHLLKTRSLSSWGLASAVSSPPSRSYRSPAAKHIKYVLLCIIM